MTDDLPVVKSIKFVRESELTYRLRVGIHQSVDEQALREEAADRIQKLEAALSPLMTSTELKLVEKNCDWIAFQHAFNALMRSRRTALAGEKKDD
jgi:hypothetical protein